MVRTRLKALLVVLAIPFALVVTRLWMLQVDPDSRERFLREGTRQHIAHIPLAPRRGRIVDRNGVVLAENVACYDLLFVPNELDPWPRRAAIERIVREIVEAGAEFQFEADALEEHMLAAVRRARLFPHRMPRTLPFLEDIPRKAASALASYIDRHPAFELRESDGKVAIDIVLVEALSLEDKLEELATLLPGCTVTELEEAVARRYREIEAHLARRHGSGENDEKRNERFMLRERSALLRADISLDAVTMLEYEHERFPGLSVRDSTRRHYPQGEPSGALVGYMRRLNEADIERLENEDRLLELERYGDLGAFRDARLGVLHRDDLVGAVGLEAQYDAELRGLYGARQVRRDSRGRHVGTDFDRLPPVDGQTLRTTLDARLQKVLYDAIARRARELGGRGGSAVVMEISPRLGALHASVGYPGFDANRMREKGYRDERNDRFGPKSYWELDRPLLLSLPPGSVFKLVTTIASLESGLAHDGVVPSSTISFPCEGGYQVGDRFLRCHSEVGHGIGGDIDLVAGLKYSCNSCFYRLAHHHLTHEILYSWAWALGYGRHPGLDLPPSPQQETGTGRLARGILVDPARPDRRLGEASACTLAIGQEVIDATPLQVLRSTAAVAIRGRALPVPWLVTPAPAEPLPKIDEETIELVWKGMREVVRSGGTAGKLDYGLRGYSIALKTGTAQYTSKEKRWHAWVCGFGPLPEPRFAFVIVIEEAAAGGGEGCAPVLRTLLEYLEESCPELAGGRA